MPWRFDQLGIEPAQIGAMHAAYEKACTSLGPDRINEILVTKIVELSQTERDADRLCEKVLAYYHAYGDETG